MMKRIGLILFTVSFIASVGYFMIVENKTEQITYKDGPYVLNIFNDSFKVLEFDSDTAATTGINIKYTNVERVKFLDRVIAKNVTAPLSDSISLFANVDSVFSVGDLHGEYEAIVDLLKNNLVIDDHLNWNFGTGHLVFCGDVFDRGSKVTECLWFIYKLEQQAYQAGGKVHFLLGNHEIMTLSGDLRYLHRKYKTIQEKSGIPYSFLFNENTFFGKWMREKNAVVKINNTIYVHGGLHPDLIKRNISVEKMNALIRTYLNHQDFSEEISFLINTHGPLWYRGYVQDDKAYRKTTQSEIDKLLVHYNAERIVFAHTTVSDILPLYQSKVFAIDVPLSNQKGKALLIVGDETYKIDKTGTRTIIK